MQTETHDSIFGAKARNLRAAWDHFRSRETAVTSLPFRGIIELTQNCNFRCTMCAQSWDPRYARHDPTLNMSLEEFARIGAQLFPLALSVDLRGFGESTILPYWPEVLDFLESYPLVEWNIVTNLALPRDEVWRKMCALDFAIGFSCDGGTRETFEAIRVRANFERILHNLKVVQEAIREQRHGFIYFISTVQKRNLHELREIVELAREHGVTEVQFKAVQGERPELKIDDVDRELIKRHAAAALDVAYEAGIRLTFNDRLFTTGLDPARLAAVSRFRLKKDHLLEYIERHGLAEPLRSIAESARVAEHQSCFKSFSFVYIDYRSKVGTCNHMMHPTILEMGDLREQDLATIWNGDRFRAFRAQHVEARPEDPRCQWCFAHRLDD